MTALWLSTAAFARLRAITRRRAQQVLAGWLRAPLSPRVRVVAGGRGRPALQVLAEDVAALYALDVGDVHQLAA